MRIAKVQRPDSGGQNGMRSHDVEFRWFRLLSFVSDGRVVEIEKGTAILANGKEICQRHREDQP
jgi:hypothetical protein